jgi:DNA uptake protein ComE-like DNA-binding protein
MRIHALVLGLVLPVFAATAAFSQGTMAPSTAPAAKPAATTGTAPTATKPGELIDINSASKEQLVPLKGIGDVRAEAIIKGRPYKGKDDLVQKKILSKNVYDGIKDQIIAKQK